MGLRFLIPAIVILAGAPIGMMWLTWYERKVIARMQDRFGPNRVGPYGLLQPVADGIKMLTKEDLVPEGADRLMHTLAPVLMVVPSLFLFTVLPLAPGVVAAPLATGLLFFMAAGSSETLAVFMAGWGSRNKFSLLGALRSAAQMISYEVPLLLTLAVVPLAAGSLNLVEVVKAQEGFRWFCATPWGLTALALTLIAGLAEVNRTPFDLPEAESEIVAGFHTEFSGMKFALFYMAEFLSTLALAALAAGLFLGGWDGPALGAVPGRLSGAFWMLAKTLGMVFVIFWIRATLPRFRMDQLMSFAWKVMVPLALANGLGACLAILRPGLAGSVVSAILSLGAFLVFTQLWLAPKPHLTTKWVGPALTLAVSPPDESSWGGETRRAWHGGAWEPGPPK